MTAPTKIKKPAKPHKDFPLFAHASGRWAKKVRGRLHYFGPWIDPQGALERWLDGKDDILAGRKPRTGGQGITLADVCNEWLASKEKLLARGELQQVSFDRYEATAKMLVGVLGRKTKVDRLQPEDFTCVKDHMDERRWSVIVQHNEIAYVSSLFKFALKKKLIKEPVDFGEDFKPPSWKVIRRQLRAKGRRLFTQQQIHDTLAIATPQVKAMVLLGIQSGIGNSDLARMTFDDIDLDDAWCDYPRHKTEAERAFPLWPETVAAIRDMLEARPDSSERGADRLLFIGATGRSYLDGGKGRRVHQATRYAFQSAGVTDRTFYDLRRTFQTVAEDLCPDSKAVSAIMGHSTKPNDMPGRYRQGLPSRKRLKAVTDAMRRWLFGKRVPR